MLNLITVLIAFPLVAGYLGWVHPVLDAFSHFRLYALALWIVWLVIRGVLARGSRRYTWWLSALLFGGVLYGVMRPFSASAGPEKGVGMTLSHLQYNINLHNPQLDTILRYIRKHRPDIVTLQEVTHAQEKRFRSLADEGYRWQAYCMRKTTQEAILSRHPFVAGSVRCEEHQGFVSARIDLGEKQLSVASIHLFLPFPYGQQAQVDRLKGALLSRKKPLLIAGDFNAAPWSHTVKKVEQYSQTHVVPGLRLTIPTDYHRNPYIPLPIDQVLVSPGIEVLSAKRGPHMGSDHWPVVTRISL